MIAEYTDKAGRQTSDRHLSSPDKDRQLRPTRPTRGIWEEMGRGFLPQAQMGEISASLARVRQYTYLYPNPRAVPRTVRSVMEPPHPVFLHSREKRTKQPIQDTGRGDPPIDLHGQKEDTTRDTAQQV